MTARLAERAARVLERLSQGIGFAVAWLGIPAMILLAAIEPLARWVGWHADASFGDASTSAFFATTMTSFGYAYAAGAHVRLKILSRCFPPRVNAAIEFAGTVFVLLPLCAIVVIDGVDSTWRSLLQGEHWADTAWGLQ